MSSSSYLSGLLRAGRRGVPSLSTHRHLQVQLRYKHQVRVIITQDLPEGQKRGVYAGEVHNVSAGYARNYLVPKKMAVYATPVNFERCGLIDPDIAAKEKVVNPLGEEESEDLKAADILRKYLRNKSVRIIRNVDNNLPTMCHPGHVSAKNLRDKLSKQLKIDLEEHETIHIRNEPVVALDDKDDQELMQMLKEMDEEDFGAKEFIKGDEAGVGGDGDAVVNIEAGGSDESADDVGEAGQPNADKEVVAAEQSAPKDCDTKVKQLGDYVAKITLAGGYVVPLKFKVERR